MNKQQIRTVSVESAILASNRVATKNDLPLIAEELRKRGVKCTVNKSSTRLGYPVLKQAKSGWVVQVDVDQAGVVETEIRDRSRSLGMTPQEIFYCIMTVSGTQTRQQRRAAERLEAKQQLHNSGLRKIFKINLLTLKHEIVTLGDSELMRWLDKREEAECGIIKIQHMHTGKQEDDEQLDARLAIALEAGIKVNGCIYVPLCVTSSDARNATSVWIKEELHREAFTWLTCGLGLAKLEIAPNKFCVYLGLSLSSSRPFSDVFGCAVDLRRAVIVPDKKVKVVAPEASLVTADSVTRVTNREIELNVFDGQALIESRLTKGQACTIRAAFMKGLAVPFPIKQWMWKHCIEGITDIWGWSHPRDEIDLIIPESVFKAAHWYTDYDQYLDAFEALEREVCVCVQEHRPRSVALAYQGLQSLVGCSDEDLQGLVDHSAAALSQYTNPARAAKLLGGHLAEAARLNPNLMADTRVAEHLQESYTSRLNEAKSAKLLASGVMPFIAADPVAMMEHACGMEVVGRLKADECCCHSVNEGPVVLVRYPHFNNSSFVRITNVRRPGKEFMGPTLYVSIYDLVAIRLRADFDGDHVWISSNEALLKAIDASQAYMKKPLADWDAPSAAKVKWNPRLVQDYVRTLTEPSEIGVYANNATRLWAKFDKYVAEGDTENAALCIKAIDWLEWAGNILIDKTKHGSAKVEAPEDLRTMWSTKETLPNGYGRTYTKYTLDPMPFFHYYAKRMPTRIAQAIKDAGKLYRSMKAGGQLSEFMAMWHPSDDIRYLECPAFEGVCMIQAEGDPTFIQSPALLRKYQANTSIGNRYARLIHQAVPDKLVVTGSEDFRFSYTMLVTDPECLKIGGLFSMGRRRAGGAWVDEGLFQRIAFSRARELEAMSGEESFDPTKYRTWADYRAKIARDQIEQFAAERGFTLQDAYNAIARGLFTKQELTPQLRLLKDAFWDIFGDMAVEVIRENMTKQLAPLETGVAGTAEDCTILDDEFDIDGVVLMMDDLEGDLLAESYLLDD